MILSSAFGRRCARAVGGLLGLVLVGAALGVSVPTARGADVCVKHPSDPSVVCVRKADTIVDVCDRHADGHRAYARVITKASAPEFQSPYYDTNDSQPGCANVTFSSPVESVAVCVQTEGCSAFKQTAAPPPPPPQPPTPTPAPTTPPQGALNPRTAALTNPLFKAVTEHGSSDPSVGFFPGLGQYFVTSSRGELVRSSADLVNWRQDHYLFARTSGASAVGAAPSWVAPADQRDGVVGASKIVFLPAPINKYLLVFNALKPKGKHCLGRAISDTPYDFRTDGRAPLCGKDKKGTYSLLDPDLFWDPKTKRYYLLYKRQFQSRSGNARAPSDIVIRSMGADPRGGGLGKPVRLVVAAGRGTKEGVSVEAPTMFMRNGRYFLFYSIANYETDSYGVSVAVSRRGANRPDGGNFVKFRGNPIYSGRNNVHFCGVGHQDVVRIDNDHARLFAHAWLMERKSIGGRAPGCVTKAKHPGGNKPKRQLVADVINWDVKTDNPNVAWPRVKRGMPSGTGKTRGSLASPPP